MRTADPLGQEMASKKAERSIDLQESDSTMLTSVDKIEELQARAEATTTGKSKLAKLKRVDFGTIEVRVYPMILGDHQACSRHGPRVRNSSVFSERWQPLHR
jgi:hypothetical protein